MHSPMTPSRVEPDQLSNAGRWRLATDRLTSAVSDASNTPGGLRTQVDKPDDFRSISFA
jgi:hypothetical protein